MRFHFLDSFILIKISYWISTHHVFILKWHLGWGSAGSCIGWLSGDTLSAFRPPGLLRRLSGSASLDPIESLGDVHCWCLMGPHGPWEPGSISDLHGLREFLMKALEPSLHFVFNRIACVHWPFTVSLLGNSSAGKLGAPNVDISCFSKFAFDFVNGP